MDRRIPTIFSMERVDVVGRGREGLGDGPQWGPEAKPRYESGGRVPQTLKQNVKLVCNFNVFL